MTYQSPTQDIQFALETLADLENLASLPGLEDATLDVVAQMIEEGGKFFNDELAPTNWDADQAACRGETAHIVEARCLHGTERRSKSDRHKREGECALPGEICRFASC